MADRSNKAGVRPECQTLNGYTIQADDLPDDLAEIAEQIGLEAVLRLSELRGGEYLYLPRIERLAVAARDRAIVKDFAAGANFHDLARQYCLTERWVRAIVASHTPRRKVDKTKQVQLSII